MRSVLFVVLFYFSVDASAAAKVNNVCGEETAPLPFRYCISSTEGSTSSDLLYYLHGGGGDETEWSGFQLIREEWDRLGFQPPTIIVVSFGRLWLLAEKNTEPSSGLFEAFRASVMPTLESRALSGRTRGRRLVMGASMGGFNTIQLLAKSPSDFARAVVLCPAVIDIDPFASEADMSNDATRLGVPPDFLINLGKTVRKFYDQPAWLKSNPINLAEKMASIPPTLVTVNLEDAAFLPGGKIFGEKLKISAPQTQVVVWPGRHCSINHAVVAEFLTR